MLLGPPVALRPRAERLHEELVPVAARWIEPTRRDGPLSAYARDAEAHEPRAARRARCGEHAARGPSETIERAAPGRPRRATWRSCCRSSRSARGELAAEAIEQAARPRASASEASCARCSSVSASGCATELEQRTSGTRSSYARLRRRGAPPARGGHALLGAAARAVRPRARRPSPSASATSTRSGPGGSSRSASSTCGRRRTDMAQLEIRQKSSRTWSGSASCSRPACRLRAGTGARRRDPRPPRRRGPAPAARMHRRSGPATLAPSRSRYIPTSRPSPARVLGWSFSPKGYAGDRREPDPGRARGARSPSTARRCGRTSPSASATRRRRAAVAAARPGARAGRGLRRVHARSGQARGVAARSHGAPAARDRRAGRAALQRHVLRLISAPRGESSGWLDFRVADMAQTAGRPICTAMRLLLASGGC